MTLKEARRLQVGAIVREAWGPNSVEGLVLSKEYVKEKHMAKTLCQEKEERYDIVVHWFGRVPTYYGRPGEDTKKNPQKRQNWEIMVKLHAS